MQARQLGLFGALVARRPVILTVVIGVGVAALLAVAFRAGALQAMGPVYVGYALGLMLGVCGPLLLVAAIPDSPLPRRSAGVLLVAAAFCEPLWRDAAAPLTALWALPSTIVQLAMATIGSALLAQRWLKPGLAALASFFGAALVCIAGLAAFVSMGSAGFDGASLSSIAVNHCIAVGVTLTLCAAVWIVQRQASLFADGAGAAEAAGRAASQAAPYIAFLCLSSLASFGVDLLTNDGASPAVVGPVLLAGLVASPVAASLLGAAAVSLFRDDEHAAYLFNQRQAMMRSALDGLRPYLSTNIAIASLAIIGIVSLTAAFDLRTPLTPSELLTVVFLTIAGMGAFISVRVGLTFGTLMICVLCTTRWLIGAPGAASLPENALASPLVSPLASAMESDARIVAVAAILIAGALTAPLALEWREARSPWRKAREVALIAMLRTAPGFIAGLAVATGSLLAAYASGFWDAGAVAARWAALYAITAFALGPFWFVGFGALLGREQ